jgi:hypothetical protein
MAEAIRVTDSTTKAEWAAIHEARTRRLMAERAGLPRTWMARVRLVELAGEIDDALDQWLRVRA